MSYFEIYNKRLNRYGQNHQERMQTEREKTFEAYLAKSVYRVNFIYNRENCVGSFEKYKQDETETLAYLLTNVHLNIRSGTVLFIPNKDGKSKPWMVYYLETIKASGYNRYIMLKMTHFLKWTGRDKCTHTSWAYMYGQENNMLKDEFKARSRMDTVYDENLKSSFFVMPRTQFINKDDYLIVGSKPYEEFYRVTGYDRQSTEGIEYVTIDPVYEYDLSPSPINVDPENSEDFFWLSGGELNG